MGGPSENLVVLLIDRDRTWAHVRPRGPERKSPVAVLKALKFNRDIEARLPTSFSCACHDRPMRPAHVKADSQSWKARLGSAARLGFLDKLPCLVGGNDVGIENKDVSFFWIADSLNGFPAGGRQDKHHRISA
jgi:hypothetical protein